MKKPTLIARAVVVIVMLGSWHAAADESKLNFARDIRPILAKSCFACHGNDAATREAELRLDIRDEAIGGDVVAIVPGDSAASELIARITSDDEDVRMPPAEHAKPLSEKQIRTLSRWIDEGAEYGEHWAFVPPRQREPPIVKQNDWPKNAIDHFVLAQLEQRNLRPSQEADRATLIRRLYLDLIGLPPSPAEVDAFMRDRSGKAYEKVVDRLLQSSRYGERWAQMWLDLARYADSMGYEKDLPRTIWRYRDWVIEAFNKDKPFDQFTIEQLAGDLLPNATLDQKLATAMHRNTLTNQEGGTDDEEFRVAAVKDRVDTTMQVWMGLTMGCAKCHSHKYDPLTQEDYYRFYAIFNQTADADRGDDSPTIVTPTPEQQQRMAELDRQIAELKEAEQSDAVKKRLDELQKQRAAVKPPRTPIFQELPANKRRTTHVQVRGNFLEKGKVVDPAVPAAFGQLTGDAAKNRLSVAKWLVDPANPLTARVHVNRIWARLFGRGIVLTEEDFGTQGTLPTHPELLDWLAVEFVKRGWSQKELLRLIVSSRTYRQAALVAPELLKADPENSWLARSPRFRLEAEVLRDQALSAGGILSEKMFGASAMPPQPPGIWKVTYSNLKWKAAEGEDRYRRALYTYWRRTSPYPSMLTFDAGSRETCVVRRVRTNTPLQSLVTMNDPVFVEAAGGMAARLIREAGASNAERASYGFRLALARRPDDVERRRVVSLFEETKGHFGDHPIDAAALNKVARAARPDRISDEEFAAWIVVSNVLLNLDEVMMRP